MNCMLNSIQLALPQLQYLVFQSFMRFLNLNSISLLQRFVNNRLLERFNF